MDHKEMFEALQAEGAVKVRYKNESGLMRCIGTLMFFNPGFMTTFVTTLGETVYFPSKAGVERDYSSAWATLCHELVHVEDYRASKPRFLFMLLYGFPQVLALLALLAIPLWSWWPLLFILCLAPIPAPWRRRTEMRGYAMDMAVWYWYRGSGIPQGLKSSIVSHFTSAEYYWMYPFKDTVTQEVGRWSKAILCNELEGQGDVYRRVREAIMVRRQHKL